MNSPVKTDERTPKQKHAEKRREERDLEKGVEDTFPASDPPSASQPGGGITGPEVVHEKKHPR
jgi:hypothetical protein